MAKNLTQYWDTLDTYDRERSQLIQLRHFLTKKVIPFSGHYGRMFEKLRLDPNDIRSFDDWAEIPFTTKDDLLSAPKEFELIADKEVLSRQMEVVRRGFTKGRKRLDVELAEEFRPVMEINSLLYTNHDIENMRKAGGRILALGGSEPDFRHINTFPYGPFLAFWQAHYAGVEQDSFMISSGGAVVSDIAEHVDMTLRISPEVLIGSPTFIYHLLQLTLDRGGKLPRLKSIVTGGDKLPKGFRRKFLHLACELDAPNITVISTYGFAEAKMLFPECPVPVSAENGSGFHIYPDMAFVEVIDPDTGKPVGENEPGEIVMTPLDSRGTVVLRYRTGDLAEHGISHQKCEFCGRSVPRLRGRISRLNNNQQINNQSFDLNDLESILDDIDDLGAWQIEIRDRNDDPKQEDELLIHTSSNGSSDRNELKWQIEKRFSGVSEVKPDEVRFHSPAQIRKLQGIGSESRECRFVDNREK